MWLSVVMGAAAAKLARAVETRAIVPNIVNRVWTGTEWRTKKVER